MANVYRPVSARAKALYGEKPLELDLSAVDERDHLDGGHLQIVPREYLVLTNNFSAGKQGSKVFLVLPVEQEAALVQGGHIQRTTDKKG